MKLLVVDDQGPVGEIISRIARQGGWEAIHTTHADDLTTRIIADEVSVLLIDYAMDGNPHSTRNGLTVAAELRSASINIPIIIFSGWPNMIDAKRAKEARHSQGPREAAQHPGSPGDPRGGPPAGGEDGRCLTRLTPAGWDQASASEIISRRASGLKGLRRKFRAVR